MSAMAAVEMGHYRPLAARLVALGVAPAVAMEPFVAALETYHSLTEPSTWLESVVKAYVGDGMAADFYREVAEFVDPRHPRADPRGARRRRSGRVRGARGARRDRRAARRGRDRLALWARRLVGEAISQTQHVLADRDALMVLLMRGHRRPHRRSATLITRITDRHDERMAELGLSG